MLGTTHTLTLIPGDGIGPEVTAAVTSVLDAAGVAIEWDRHDAGVVAFETTGQTLPEGMVPLLHASPQRDALRTDANSIIRPCVPVRRPSAL